MLALTEELVAITKTYAAPIAPARRRAFYEKVDELLRGVAQDEVLSAGLVPEFFVDRAGGGGPNITATSWVNQQSPVFGDMVELGTVVSMSVTDTEQS